VAVARTQEERLLRCLRAELDVMRKRLASVEAKKLKIGRLREQMGQLRASLTRARASIEMRDRRIVDLSCWCVLSATDVGEKDMTRLRLEAMRRGTNVGGMVLEIVRNVVADDLFCAVLDK
jgi:hypothetical protein